jgi:hypothetical protein
MKGVLIVEAPPQRLVAIGRGCIGLPLRVVVVEGTYDADGAGFAIAGINMRTPLQDRSPDLAHVRAGGAYLSAERLVDESPKKQPDCRNRWLDANVEHL